MQWTHHGGQCCGMRHIYDMNYVMSDERIAELNKTRPEIRQISRNKNHNISDMIKDMVRGFGLIEIVVTDYQMLNNLELMKQLKENNFHLVSRFENPNSNNFCNVFHRYGSSGQEENELEGSPYLKYLGDK